MLFRLTLCAVLTAGMLAVTSSAQAGELTDKLVGSWVPDVEKTIELLKKSGDFDDDQINEIQEELGGGITLTIKKDNKFKVNIEEAGEELDGEWKVSKEEKDGKVTLTMTIKMDELELPMEFTFTNMEGDYVQVAPEDQPPAVFKKKTD